ncbi:hypothetical protein SPWS13_4218 [Shewanella putrefaciens]|nr:hypothetical protein SPWS13_4218 [Shewanella putrefaciens]
MNFLRQTYGNAHISSLREVEALSCITNALEVREERHPW